MLNLIGLSFLVVLMLTSKFKDLEKLLKFLMIDKCIIQNRHDITETLLKVALNTITPNYLKYVLFSLILKRSYAKFELVWLKYLQYVYLMS